MCGGSILSCFSHNPHKHEQVMKIYRDRERLLKINILTAAMIPPGHSAPGLTAITES